MVCIDIGLAVSTTCTLPLVVKALYTYSRKSSLVRADVVKVMDFHNQCPIVQMLHRTGQLLSIKGEKVSEVSLYTALTKTFAEFPQIVRSMIDFTSCESVFLDRVQNDTRETMPTGSTQEPYYVIFLELEFSSLKKDSRGREAKLSRKVF